MLNLENLHPYQRRMMDTALKLGSAGLLMDMGLGKTITTLSIIAARKSKTLVVAPKAVAQNVWAQQAAEWDHTKHLKFSMVLGNPKQRLAAVKADADVHVINLENVVWLFEQKGLPQWDTLVIDESSKFKNTKSQRWRALKGVLKHFKYRFILTGTPTPKSYIDLWTQVGIIDLGQRLGTSITKFKDQYFDPDQRDRRTGVVWSWKLKEGAKEQIDKKIGDICFSLKAEDYLKMPSRKDITHTIAWSETAREQYDDMRKNMVSQIKGDDISAATAGVLSNKLLQMASGEVYDENKKALHVHSNKIDYLLGILNESPTMIFYNYKHSLDRLRQAIPDAVVLDPEDSETMKRWRKGEINVLLCHPLRVGIGLNLQCNAGNTVQVVWFDLTWSPEDYLQANARVFRQGQEKPTVFHHLAMENSVDKHVMDVLQGKINQQEALMQALKL